MRHHDVRRKAETMPLYRDLTEDEMAAGTALIRHARRDARYDDRAPDSVRWRVVEKLIDEVAGEHGIEPKLLAFVTGEMLVGRLTAVRFPDDLAATADAPVGPTP